MEFMRQMEALPENKRLRIATIFSYAANEEVDDSGDTEENNDSTEGLDKSSRDFLEKAIADYNKMFNTNYDTSRPNHPAHFDGYDIYISDFKTSDFSDSKQITYIINKNNQT